MLRHVLEGLRPQAVLLHGRLQLHRKAPAHADDVKAAGRAAGECSVGSTTASLQWHLFDA